MIALRNSGRDDTVAVNCFIFDDEQKSATLCILMWEVVKWHFWSKYPFPINRQESRESMSLELNVDPIKSMGLFPLRIKGLREWRWGRTVHSSKSQCGQLSPHPSERNWLQFA